MSGKEIFQHGMICFQQLVKNQKELAKAEDSISAYFDSRKDNLSRILEKL